MGKFQLLRELGAGGMGRVFEARDTLLGRLVAIKLLHAEGLDPDLLLRGALRESRVLAALNHPHIVQLHEVGMSEETPYFVMELVRGRSLRAVCNDYGALEVLDALGIALQIGEGLCVAHAAGIVHNDLKPENVMLSTAPAGQVKLVDFGLSRTVERASTGTTAELVDGRGTPHYMAPELHRGERATPRSDVYTWGQILHEMLTGQFLFGQSMDEAPARREVGRLHLVARPASIVGIRGSRLGRVESVVMRMLAKEPARRPDAPEALRELRCALERLEVEAPELSERTLTGTPAPVHHSLPPPAPASPARTAGPERPQPRRIAVALGVACTTAALLAYVIRPERGAARWPARPMGSFRGLPVGPGASGGGASSGASSGLARAQGDVAKGATPVIVSAPTPMVGATREPVGAPPGTRGMAGTVGTPPATAQSAGAPGAPGGIAPLVRACDRLPGGCYPEADCVDLPVFPRCNRALVPAGTAGTAAAPGGHGQ